MFRRYDCTTVSRMLPLHAGGDLDTRHQAAVDEHLHACLNCFREFRELASLRGQLRAAAEEPLPEGILDGFTEDVMARVRSGEVGPVAVPPRASVLRLPRVLAAAAVLAVAGLAVTLNLESSGSGPRTLSDLPLVADDVVEAPRAEGDRQAIGWPAPSIRDVGGSGLPAFGDGAQGTPASGGSLSGRIGPMNHSPMNTSGLSLDDRFMTGTPQLSIGQLEEMLGLHFDGKMKVAVQQVEVPSQPGEKMHLFLLTEGRLQELAESGLLRTQFQRLPESADGR